MYPLVKNESRQQNLIHHYGLSEREVEVLKLLAQGLRNNEISERLFLSGGTVKNYISNIYAKLEVKGRREAADKAKRRRIFLGNMTYISHHFLEGIMFNY